MMARSEKADRIDPTDANEPTENADRADPIEPTDANEPMQPMLSTEFRLAMLSTEFSERIDHLEVFMTVIVPPDRPGATG